MEFILLSKGLTKYYCDRILMPQGATSELVRIAESVNKDPKLYKIYEDFYRDYIDSGYWTTVWEPLNIHPYVEEVFGNHSSLFYLHIALEKLPFAEQKYAERGLDESLFIETLRDIGVWVQHAYDRTGYYGILNFGWIWRHLEARMFKLGRLQYLPKPYGLDSKDGGDVKGFYNPQKGLLLLCNTGLELRANGDMQGVCEKEKTPDGFTTEYEETEEFIVGNPVTPYGKGLKERIRLKKGEWEKVLDLGDYLLEVHIPKEGKFDLENIADSYRQAKEFFKKYFPELDIKGMTCHTWQFTPQLQEMLPHTSNLVRFQRQFYLYPTKGSVSFLWDFVFGEWTKLKDAKSDTSLKKQVLSYIEEGREIFDMRGVFLDVDGSFGGPSYMDRYDIGKYSYLQMT